MVGRPRLRPAHTHWRAVQSKGLPLTLLVEAANALTKGYDLLSSINGGEGFWVNANASFTAQLPIGSAVTSASFKTMPSGWSLVAVGDNPTASGFNSALSSTPPATGVIPTNLTSLWAWDATSQKWYFYAPSLEAQGGTALTDYISNHGFKDFSNSGKTLGPNTGFWVNRP